MESQRCSQRIRARKTCEDKPLTNTVAPKRKKETSDLLELLREENKRVKSSEKAALEKVEEQKRLLAEQKIQTENANETIREMMKKFHESSDECERQKEHIRQLEKEIEETKKQVVKGNSIEKVGCGICHRPYTTEEPRSPRIFPCGHTCCATCVDQTPKRISTWCSCPFCNKNSFVSKAKKLPVNYALLDN